MDCSRHFRRCGLPMLLLALALPPVTMASAPTAPEARAERTAKAKPRKPRLSPTSLSAPAITVAPEPVAVPSNPAAARLSPVLRRPVEATAAADPVRVAVVPEGPETALTKAIAGVDSGSALKLSDKGRPLPAQEEGLALARAMAVPVDGYGSDDAGESAVARVEKGVETGPMRLRVRKQAVQMSVEFPFQ